MIAVYTCVAGGYDNLIKQPSYHGVEYFCFSEKTDPCQFKGWNMIPLKSPLGLKDPYLINRFHKINCYGSFKNSEYSIYIDGNILLKTNPITFIESIKGTNLKIGAFKHPQRSTIEQELEACISQNKILHSDLQTVKNFISDTQDKGFRNQNGLSGNYILVRKQDDELLAQVMKDWWLIVSGKVKRDQLSLQFLLWSRNMKWSAIDNYISAENSFLQIPHGGYVDFLPLELQVFFKKLFIKLKTLNQMI